MSVVTYPIVPRGDVCLACGQPMTTHLDRCTRDVVLARDQETVARRLRLARLQMGRGRRRPCVEGV